MVTDDIRRGGGDPCIDRCRQLLGKSCIMANLEAAAYQQHKKRGRSRGQPSYQRLPKPLCRCHYRLGY